MKRIGLAALVLTISVIGTACNAEPVPTTRVVESALSTDSTLPTDHPTTTTRPVATTTTPPPIDGKALILSNGVVLGWWEDGEWHQQADYSQLTGDIEFKVLPFGEDPFNVTAGDPVSHCEWLVDNSWWFGQDLVAQRFSQIAISAPWDVTEAAFKETLADQSLIEVVSAHLLTQGIEMESPVFSQLVDVDLEGDHRPEVIAVLDNEAGISGASEKAYGLALVRHDDGEVQILGEFRSSGGPATDGFSYSVYQYRLVALVDVNRDGLVEVGLEVVGDEGGGTSLYEMDPTGKALSPVLGAGCGS